VSLFSTEQLPFGFRWRLAGSYLSPDTLPGLVSLPWIKDCGLYLHRIDKPDGDRHPHCHPYTFGSLVLWGGYRQEIWLPDGTVKIDWRRPGHFAVMPRDHYHRITELTDGQPCYTLFFAGEPLWNADGSHRWGFNVNGQHIGWQEYREMNK
jgi:hypothetical protein